MDEREEAVLVKFNIEALPETGGSPTKMEQKVTIAYDDLPKVLLEKSPNAKFAFFKQVVPPELAYAHGMALISSALMELVAIQELGRRCLLQLSGVTAAP